MNDLHFQVIENDKTKDCKVLHYFTNNNNNYMIFTDYTYDKNGKVNVYAAKYVIDGENISLIDVDDNEIDMINKKWNGVNNE